MCSAEYRDTPFHLSTEEWDGALQSILVDVEIIPETASCQIYGVANDGNSACVTVGGRHTQVDLPFASPYVLVRHPENVQVRIGTIGCRRLTCNLYH